MASYHFLCFLLTSLLLSFASPSFSSSRYSVAMERDPPVPSSEPFPSLHAEKIATSSENVELSLYYESLCPYCQSFITTNLANAVDTDLMTIINLRMVPWGNAIVENDTIICQHGGEECYLNAIQACGIHLWPDVITHFNFIKCIEKGSSANPLRHGAEEVWKDCAKQQGLAVKPIEDCYDSGVGRKLVLQFGNETDQLQPPHEYVPWVTVDKKPILEDYENFVTYVCKAYKGTELPKACTVHPSYYTRKAKAISVKGAQLHQKKTKPSA